MHRSRFFIIFQKERIDMSFTSLISMANKISKTYKINKFIKKEDYYEV